MEDSELPSVRGVHSSRAEQQHRGLNAVKLLDCILLVVRTDAARDRPQTQQQ